MCGSNFASALAQPNGFACTPEEFDVHLQNIDSSLPSFSWSTLKPASFEPFLCDSVGRVITSEAHTSLKSDDDKELSRPQISSPRYLPVAEIPSHEAVIVSRVIPSSSDADILKGKDVIPVEQHETTESFDFCDNDNNIKKKTVSNGPTYMDSCTNLESERKRKKSKLNNSTTRVSSRIFEKADNLIKPCYVQSKEKHVSNEKKSKRKKADPSIEKKEAKYTPKPGNRLRVKHDYVDYSGVSFESKILPPPGSSKSKALKTKRLNFTEKLHLMLEQVEVQMCPNDEPLPPSVIDGTTPSAFPGKMCSSIISWQPHGRCFVVHLPDRFVKSILPQFFDQSKLTSFQRQLNLYGFRRITNRASPDVGAYYHELFLRYRIDLCYKMVRVKVKGTGCKAAQSPETEPNFYKMNPIVLSVIQNQCFTDVPIVNSKAESDIPQINETSAYLDAFKNELPIREVCIKPEYEPDKINGGHCPDREIASGKFISECFTKDIMQKAPSLSIPSSLLSYCDFNISKEHSFGVEPHSSNGHLGEAETVHPLDKFSFFPKNSTGETQDFSTSDTFVSTEISSIFNSEDSDGSLFNSLLDDEYY